MFAPLALRTVKLVPERSVPLVCLAIKRTKMVNVWLTASKLTLDVKNVLIKMSVSSVLLDSKLMAMADVYLAAMYLNSLMLD
jgi:hypothetical protein